MSSIKISATVLAATILIASVVAAPIGTTEEGETELTVSTTTTTTSVTETTTSPKPTEETTQMPEFTSYKNTSTFSCAGRITGYYADVKLGCRIYHFCSAMDGIGETHYERMSYICLEGSIFDQKDLNCVRETDAKTPCFEAESEYESSNKQFDHKDDDIPSISDNLAANIMMNPLARFIAG